MNPKRSHYVLVGFFVLAIAAGLIVTLALLTGRTGATETYYTHYDTVTGIKHGTPVLFSGYPVGQVTAVEPEYTQGELRFRVALAIAEDWPVPAGSVAQVRASGLLGIVSINIREGDGDALLPPGETLASEPAPNLFATLANAASLVDDLARRDLRPLLQNINALVTSMNTLAAGDAAEMLADLRSTADKLDAGTDEFVTNLVALSALLRENGERLSTLLDTENLQRVDSTLAGVDATARNFAQLSASLEDTRGDLDRLLANLNALVSDNKLDVDRTVMDLRYTMHAIAQRIDAVSANLEGTSRNMFEFTRQLRQNPASIFGTARTPDDFRE